MDSEEENLLGVDRVSGLGLFTAVVILSGEMAGSGVLSLPKALIGTGWSGLLLILFFTINGAYIGSRLGLCWEILAETFEDFNQTHVRDPYPLIAEKAGLGKGPRVAKLLRTISIACIIATLYGSGCVFIVLISDFANSITGSLSVCLWMVIATLLLTPLTWLGTPKDFWPIAVGALFTTVTACILTMIQLRIDLNEGTVNCDKNTSFVNSTFEPVYPNPTPNGYFEAFASIMFAFGGASTFPTIQADMADKGRFKWAAVSALCILFVIYAPVASVGYFTLGDCVNSNVIMSLSKGPVRTAAEVVLLLHLVTALPIVVNPPSQYFEEVLHIPQNFNWKRCLFRTCTMLLLLFIAETIPNFGSILDLVGASSVTLLTFIFPPMLFIFASDASTSRTLSLAERIYCWFLVLVGIIGGLTATYTAIKNIVATEFSLPCYVK